MTLSKYSRPWRVSLSLNWHLYERELRRIQSSQTMHSLISPLMISSIRTFVSVLFQVSPMEKDNKIEHQQSPVELVEQMLMMDWIGTRPMNSNLRTREQLLRREHRLIKTKLRESNYWKRGKHKRNDTFTSSYKNYCGRQRFKLYSNKLTLIAAFIILSFKFQINNY